MLKSAKASVCSHSQLAPSTSTDVLQTPVPTEKPEHPQDTAGAGPRAPKKGGLACKAGLQDPVTQMQRSGTLSHLGISVQTSQRG